MLALLTKLHMEEWSTTLASTLYLLL
jgi:hypothetical protein